jgi:hypothetical protein
MPFGLPSPEEIKRMADANSQWQAQVLTVLCEIRDQLAKRP